MRGMNFDMFFVALRTWSLNLKFTSETTPKNMNDYTLLMDALLIYIGGRKKSELAYWFDETS